MRRKRPFHPTGAKPAGNAFLAENGGRPSLGVLAQIGGESVLVAFCGEYLSPRDVCRLSGCSRHLFALCNHIDIWRQFAMNAVVTRGEREGDYVLGYDRSWKRTAIRKFLANEGCNGVDAKMELLSGPLPRMSGGVFSDYLYKPFLCATAEIDGRWTCERNIERRDAADLSVKEFVEKYERGAGVPLIITGLASRWPAVRGGKASRNDDRNVSGTEQKERSTTSDSSNAGHGERESGAPSLGKAWTEANLLDAAGDARLLCGGFPYRLSDFFAYQRQVAAAAEGEGGEEGEGEGRKQVGSVGSGGEPDDQTLYLFDHRFQDKVPALRGGAGRDWSCPRYFAGGDRDLFSLLGDERPRHSWIIAGCKRSGSNWHQDPNATSAWNAVIRGAKKWILLPPDVIPPGVHPSEDHATVATPLSPMEWFLDFYPALGSLPRRQRDRCVEAVCREGEIMFIPSGWWHTVLNLEDSLAITQNYVSPSNLEACLRFLLLRNTQVSGYDRDEDKRSLHRRFVAALRRDRPSLLEACSGVARGEKGVAESKRGEGEEKGGEGREKKGKVAGLGAIFSQERKKRKENRKKRAKKTTKKKGTGEIDTEEEGDDDDEGAQGGGFSFSFSF